ncbi:exoribonuclease R, partial [Xanthomonas vesicatoria ATCC 35937]
MTKKNNPDSDRPSRRKSASPGESTTAEQQKLPGWMPDFLVRAAAGASTKSANKRAAAKASSDQPAPPAEPAAPRAPHPRKSGPPAPPPERFQKEAVQAVVDAGFKDPHADREALRYAEPIASREAILQLLEACDGPQTAEEIAEQLGLSDRIDALGKRLAAMVREAQLVQNRRGGYAPVQQTSLIAGVVIANPEGFGFLKPDEGGDDLFLPPFEMRKVMHGDRALANVTGIDRRGRREGAIARVLERRMSRMIGRFFYEHGVAYVDPDDKRVQRNVQIAPDGIGEAREGQLVVCELIAPPDARRPAIGKIIAVLGDKLTPSLVVEMAIHGHELPHEFPQEVLDEAAAVPLVVEPQMIGGRVDLRQMPLVTIDGED